MAIDPLSPEQLGNILLDIWRSGASSDALGRFACLQTAKAIPHQLTDSQWGTILMNLARAETTPMVLGQFVLAQAASAPGQQTLENARKTSVPVAAITDIAEQKAVNRAFQPLKLKPTANERTKLTFNGNSSVSVPSALVDKYLEVFDKASLRELLNAVATASRPAGVTRSYQVQQEIKTQLAMQEIPSYPHGIRLIQGG